MNKYELAIITKGSLPADEEKKIEADLRALVGKYAKLTAEDPWGKRRLAYKIDKDEQGYYLFFEIEAEPAKIKSLNDDLRHRSDLLRFLITRV